jgi:hypothetical protein
MRYEEFKQVVVFGGKEPNEWDFYRVTFNSPKTDQEFFDYFYEKIPNLDQYPFHQRMGQFYICLAKGTILPENFCDFLEKAE